MVRVLGVGALAGSLLLLVSACGGSGHLFRRDGITVAVPTGWQVSTRPLTSVTDPVERFVLSSAPVPAYANGGNGYVPPSHAVLADLVEEIPPDYSNPWPKRPAHFRLPRLSGMETFAGNRWGELLFRDRGRHFYIFVWAGRDANAAEVASLMRALDHLQVRAS